MGILLTKTRSTTRSTTDEAPRVDHGGQTFTSVTDHICGIVEREGAPKAWWISIGISSSLAAMMFAMIGWLIYKASASGV